jgi:hypothetical protein
MRVRFPAIVLMVVVLACFGFAQASDLPSSATGANADCQATVKKQFGSDFEVVTVSPMSQIGGAVIEERRNLPWSPILTGDLDGDGVEDAIIIARNKNALIGSEPYAYKVVDPFHEQYGWGKPKITGQFNAHDPLHNLHLLIIHGVGAEGWRAEKPKAKYVLINIPIEQVSLARAVLKKKPVDAIRVEESDTISSLVFWDGKKYRYVPGGAMN